jgi:hypothetical protein
VRGKTILIFHKLSRWNETQKLASIFLILVKINSANVQRFFNFRLLLESRRPLANNGFGLNAGRVCDALNCQPTTNLQKKYWTSKFVQNARLALSPCYWLVVTTWFTKHTHLIFHTSACGRLLAVFRIPKKCHTKKSLKSKSQQSQNESHAKNVLKCVAKNF